MEPVNTQTSFIVALLDLLGPDYTTVVVQLWLYPLVQRGAVSCPRILTKRDLISQLRLETTCGGEGDWCICYVNTYPLEAEGRHINPGDYIACWAAERDQEDEVLRLSRLQNLLNHVKRNQSNSFSKGADVGSRHHTHRTTINASEKIQVQASTWQDPRQSEVEVNLCPSLSCVSAVHLVEL